MRQSGRATQDKRTTNQAQLRAVAVLFSFASPQHRTPASCAAGATRRLVPRNSCHASIPVGTGGWLAVWLPRWKASKGAHRDVRLRQTQAITHKSVLDHPHAPLAELYKFMLENHTVDDSCAPDFR